MMVLMVPLANLVAKVLEAKMVPLVLLAHPVKAQVSAQPTVPIVLVPLVHLVLPVLLVQKVIKVKMAGLDPKEKWAPMAHKV